MSKATADEGMREALERIASAITAHGKEIGKEGASGMGAIESVGAGLVMLVEAIQGHGVDTDTIREGLEAIANGLGHSDSNAGCEAIAGAIEAVANNTGSSDVAESLEVGCEKIATAIARLAEAMFQINHTLTEREGG